jgi:mono/diheme cytochrome c family protein
MKTASGIVRRLFGPASVVGSSVLMGLAIWLGAAAHVPAGPDTAAPAPNRPVDAKQLYAQHCQACHGERGDGNGPAARFLYPRPRNFGDAKFRLVTTANGIPTDRDLFATITRGMPGSAMFPFGHLSDAERLALVGQVRTLIRSAFIERAKHEAEAGGEKVNLAELEKDVDEVLKPGDVLAVPADLPNADAASMARGKAAYLKSCNSCHGDTGKGDGVQEQKNNDGTPTSPRDFTRGIFKGGRDTAALFTRIRLGMPGSPMPGNDISTSAEVADLAHFIQSLAPSNAQDRVEHRRTTVTARRVPEPLLDAIPEAVWETAPAARIVVSPLWWRDYAEPELTIRAAHDGRTLALRLTWRDATQDDHPVRPQDFEDMAAVQLVKGPAEPFLGMGAADGPVELWLWQAGWSAAKRADVETAHPNMAVDIYPFEKPGGSHALDRQPPEYITAKAARNPRSDPDRGFTGNGLAAKGIGSVTFRPRASQLVGGKGEWKDGRWTVTLRRPLAVPADAGLSIAPGERVSAAFALWDGAARDRNGQKMVSIWHDLRLDP